MIFFKLQNVVFQSYKQLLSFSPTFLTMHVISVDLIILWLQLPNDISKKN